MEYGHTTFATTYCDNLIGGVAVGDINKWGQHCSLLPPTVIS